MKKYMILVAIATLTLASCAKIETINTNPVLDENVPIGFTNYTYRSLTKADDTFVDNNSTSPLVVGKKFGVYAYSTTNNNAWTTALTATGNAVFMNGVEVEFGTNGNTDATANTYSPMRYWPSGDTPDWLTFWAYYPVQSGNGITYTTPSGSNGLGTFAFTAASTAATMVDFMVADVVNDKIYGTAAEASSNTHVAANGVVPLHFHHMLTKVQFKFKTNLTTTELENTKVYLTEAKLVDIRTQRTLNAAYTTTDGTSTSWADGTDAAAKADTPADYEIYVTADGTSTSKNVSSTDKIDLTRTATTPAASEVFLMVPQTMVAKAGTNPQVLHVEWDVVTAGVTTHNSKDLYFYSDLVTSDTDDTSVGAINWAKNNSITYTVTIGPKPIRFTADVASWDGETNGYLNVW